MRFRTAIASVVILLAGGLAPAPAEAPPPAEGRHTWVERDWLLRLAVLESGGRPLNLPTPQADAAGAVDGVKNGKWGFHTSSQDRPWWQVDLGAPIALDRAAIYNRCDGMASRAAGLMVLLSDDGKGWRKAYQHDGTTFYGATDKKPLVVDLKAATARFVRVRLPGSVYLHLDEVEVYSRGEAKRNIALARAANQSSVSQWSTGKPQDPADADPAYPIAEAIARGRALAADLAERGVPVEGCLRELRAVAQAEGALPANAPPGARRALFFRARRAVRKLALSNPLLDFQEVLFVKRVPGSYNHMSDQYYGWWSRPGGGVFVLAGWKQDRPRVRCLTEQMPPGSFLRPDLSVDGRRVLFAYCKHYPHLRGVGNKTAKDKLPEDAFYHLFEMNADGSGLRQLTRGRYDDFDGRYLPNGQIVFLSTRKGQFIQCGKASAAATNRATLPDSYVRCGGGNGRPVAVYTLHVIDPDGGNIRAISAFENFEWTPSVIADGRVTYARWDYIDRPNGPYMSLWSTNPDGTNPQLVYGNYTTRPHCIFEARAIPNSRKLIFTASAHHYQTGGSLVLLDPAVGTEGFAPLTRLTPEVRFPEAEGTCHHFYANPWPLSERYYLVAWSSVPIGREGGRMAGTGRGLYLFDAFGNLEPIYRDPAISCMYPIPLRARPRPPVRPACPNADGRQAGRFVLADVRRGLDGVDRGTVRRLRIVAVPPKTQPQMNRPSLGVTGEDPGKCVLGTVPVHADGSAHFYVPAGVPLFFQALDADGLAIQTMRTLTYVQPGQTLSCIGCHEPRNTAPPVGAVPLAARGAPSKITPGPQGSWPLRFDKLVQPVLDRHCLRCHRPGSGAKPAAKCDLTPPNAYRSLMASRKANLRRLSGERELSLPGDCVARRSMLLPMLREGKGHPKIKLDADGLDRLVTWMDTYSHRQGCFSEAQERRLAELRQKWAGLLVSP